MGYVGSVVSYIEKQQIYFSPFLSFFLSVAEWE